MWHRVIETAGFPAFLGIAATYAFVAMLSAILVANGLARAPVLWPHLLAPAGLIG
ncbi:MAG: hypothetical protein ACRD72_22475 [Candidatus Angelobacter sp.]